MEDLLERVERHVEVPDDRREEQRAGDVRRGGDVLGEPVDVNGEAGEAGGEAGER